MTIPGVYQPFLIGQGKSTTGYFTYLDSWVKPEDAYDTLINAFVYRGSLYQRSGMVLFPSVTGAGALQYQNNEIFASGNGATSYTGTLENFPIISTTLTLTATTAGGIKQQAVDSGVAFVPPWTTNAQNNISGPLLNNALQNTINYTTGAIVINTVSNVAAGIPIIAQYDFIPTNLTSNAGLPINNPIMGIKQFINETTDTNVMIVLDTRRASFWDATAKGFLPLESFQQFFYQFPNPNTFISTNNGTDILLQWTNIAPYSVTVVSSTTNPMTGVVTITGTVIDVPNNDGGATGKFTSNGVINGAASRINYNTGAINIAFTGMATAQTIVQITASLQGDYFTGDNTNFFNATNWDAPDVPAYLYLTNNKDLITTFNGTFLARPAFGLYADSVTLLAPSQVLLPFRNDVATTLDIRVFQNNLLLIRPTLFRDDNVTPNAFAENQAIYYSCPSGNLSFSPTNFVLTNEISGNGGLVLAATGDIIECVQPLRDALVVFFTNSTFLFRATNNPNDPFRFQYLNTSRSTNAPYGSVAYDVICTSMGAKGLIACDGVGVERYDVSVIDLYENINQNAFGQCFTTKYDAQNQTWMLYPSTDNNSAISNKIMVYNFLEETWAIFIPNLGNQIQDVTKVNSLSCTGLGFTTSDGIWNDFAPGGLFGPIGLSWEQAVFPWNRFLQQDLSASLLGGDQNGFVYILDDGPTDDVGPAGTTPLGIPTQVITKRLNPFTQAGEKGRFGYLDIYYEVNPGALITLNIYANNSGLVYKTFTFTLDWTSNTIPDPNAAPSFAWKRFYINVISEFIQVELNSQTGTLNDAPVFDMNAPFKILGMILWASSAGRLTPGTFL